MSEKKCPTCHSPAPHLHPAVQFEGEVQTCADDFHLQETPQNRPAFIAAVLKERARMAALEVQRPHPEAN